MVEVKKLKTLQEIYAKKGGIDYNKAFSDFMQQIKR